MGGVELSNRVGNTSQLILELEFDTQLAAEGEISYAVSLANAEDSMSASLKLMLPAAKPIRYRRFQALRC